MRGAARGGPARRRGPAGTTPATLRRPSARSRRAVDGADAERQDDGRGRTRSATMARNTPNRATMPREEDADGLEDLDHGCMVLLSVPVRLRAPRPPPVRPAALAAGRARSHPTHSRGTWCSRRTRTPASVARAARLALLHRRVGHHAPRRSAERPRMLNSRGWHVTQAGFAASTCDVVPEGHHPRAVRRPAGAAAPREVRQGVGEAAPPRRSAPTTAPSRASSSSWSSPWLR